MEKIEILRYLVLAVQREGARMLTELMSPLNVTIAQAEVLRVLQDYQPLSLIELGELLICEQGSPSRLVNGLVEIGLVERIVSPTNKRKVILTLSEQGKEIAEQIQAVELKFAAQLAQLCSDEEELDITISTLWRILKDRPLEKAMQKRLSK